MHEATSITVIPTVAYQELRPFMWMLSMTEAPLYATSRQACDEDW